MTPARESYKNIFRSTDMSFGYRLEPAAGYYPVESYHQPTQSQLNGHASPAEVQQTTGYSPDQRCYQQLPTMDGNTAAVESQKPFMFNIRDNRVFQSKQQMSAPNGMSAHHISPPAGFQRSVSQPAQISMNGGAVKQNGGVSPTHTSTEHFNIAATSPTLLGAPTDPQQRRSVSPRRIM